MIGFKTSVSTDISDKLLDPLSTPERVSNKLLINDLKLFTINNTLLNDFIPEAQEVFLKNFKIHFFFLINKFLVA